MHTNILSLLVILLSFSYVLSVSAIPATRTQNLNGQDTSVSATLAQLQGALKLETGEEMVVSMDEEIMMERRIDLEIQDYGGTGANRDHEPRSPGMVDVQNIH